jgi:protein arginine kinase
MNLLSGVRLGVGLGLIPDLSVYILNKLLVHTQPAHLAAYLGGDNAPSRSETDILRASYVRDFLASEADA